MLRQPLESAGLAQRAEVAAQPPLGQQSEHAITRGGAQSHQMLTTPEAFAQLAVTERRDPQLGHQIAGR
jgi:hypothetical protein